MKSVIGSGRRRVIAVLAATAVIVTGLGLAFSTVEAGSSVTPQNGPSGKVVHGSYKGKSQQLQTMLFQVDLNGQASFMFCIDIATYIQFGVSYSESSWAESSVPNLANVARILAQTNATVTKDPVEIAAAQAAIWHFSDGFQLDVANPKNDPAVTARYNALVSDATANPVANEPAGSLDVTPSTSSVAQGKPAFFDVTTTATTPLSIELSDAAATAHPASGEVCDVATTITTVTGNTRVCVTSTSARSNVSMTIRTGSAPVSAGRVFIRPQRQKLIIGKSGAAQSSETVSMTWTANGRPSVSIVCPSGGVKYGVPTKFSAKASDPDGDALTYLWSVNGTPVPGATGPDATLTLKSGDRVSVAVSDVVGQTATAEANCPGKNPPTVALVCPDKLVVGADNTFTALGSDPDGDTITYQWELNGVALTATTGATLTTKINAGDDLRVTAVDSSGQASASVQASCIPGKTNRPPTVKITCPVGMVYGQPATYTAVGEDPDGDALTYSWSVNGAPVAGQTGATATLTIAKGDTVSVVANDGAAASSPAEATCTGNTPNQPPTVKLTCPKGLVYGQPKDFTAVGQDPDGNSLTYAWAINGTPVAGQTGATATLTIARGDKVTVTASDGVSTSASVEVSCTGTNPNQPPTVTLECPAGMVWGTSTEFTATGSDPDGDSLTYEWKINDKVIPGAKGATVTATLQKGDVITVTVKDDKGSTSAPATGNCAGNSRPKVTLTCPTAVLYGEPVNFTAVGTDADGDALTYRWSVNGIEVVGQPGATASLVVEAGDRVNVIATDGAGTASESVTVQCAGTSRPTVTITCPASMVWGEPFDFIANGVDPDGDNDLTYSWYLNGTPVPDETGPKLNIAIDEDDVLTVTVADSEGAVSSAAAADCGGNRRPTVSLVCPEELVFDTPTTFTAVGADDDGDTLTYEWKIDDEVVEGATAATAELTIAKGQRVTVTATDDHEATSTAATSTCTGTSAPKVTTNCPARVVWGEPATFTAVGTDDDGDTLTYEWKVNGTVVTGQQLATATLTLKQGDVVSVVASDPTGLASASATFDCAGAARPKVTLVCPADFVFGQPTMLKVATESAVADELVYTWALNGKVVEGATRPSVTLTLQPNDIVGVTAVGVNGLAAITVGTSCRGDLPPTEPPVTAPPVPSMPQVLSSKIYKAATGAAVATLPVTGGEALTMALVALGALAGGLTLVAVSRRRHRRMDPAAN